MHLLLHWFIVMVYLVTPLAAVLLILMRPRMRRRRDFTRLCLTTLVATVIAGGLCAHFAMMANAIVNPWQLIKAIYFALGMLLILKGFDWLLLRATHPLALDPKAERRTILRRTGAAAGVILRLGLLVGIGLPYVMACVMTYRPRVSLSDDPMSQLGYTFKPVVFKATDGTQISGWWLPAAKGIARVGREEEKDGTQTVILCHGLAANKSNQLVMATHFVPYGYNVLIFDFRAHGESEGQLTTFGDRERQDVLGAVQWLRANHPDATKRIFGVGASMGAAALIAASVDPSVEGQSIDAIAVYGTYSRIDTLAGHVSKHFVPPLRWLVANLGVPMASWQTGCDLKKFAPAELVYDLWPRPIFIVHGMTDEVIDFEEGQALFKAATPPKRRMWINRGDHNNVINDEGATQAVRAFFEEARPIPVI